MPDTRLIASFAVSSIVSIGTLYSVIYSTYLDTSNPLLTHLPHPLGSTHYFANKSNILNTYFIKLAWAWTSAAFLANYFTAPSRIRTSKRIVQFAIETAIWMAFANWFFGPAVLERVILFSGGECVLSLPEGGAISVPTEYCFTKTTLSPQSHPELFSAGTDSISSFDNTPLGMMKFSGKPRLRRGHDISGHVFLLSMSLLFLVDQLRPSFRVAGGTWSVGHRLAVAGNVLLICIWILAAWTTSVYFHSPSEKITGLLLGIASFSMTQVPWIDSVFGSLTASREKVHAN